jgi:hypothetical protein
MTIVVENTGFTKEYWTRFSQQEFIDRNIKDGVYKDRRPEARIELLKIVYKLIIDDAP